MRKTISLIAALAVIVLGTMPARAAGSTTVVFTIGSSRYTVNGQAQTMDAAPFIDRNGRTMVPVRFLARALGASVNWNAATQTVTLIEGGTTEQMVIGSTTLTVNGRTQTMDTAPQIVPPGRTELPARFVAQAFGYTVQWDATVRTVTITSDSGESSTGGQAGTGGQGGSGGQTGAGGTGTGGRIGTALFQPIIKNLTVTVGSTTATGTDLNGKAVTVTLPAAPVLVSGSDYLKQWEDQHYPKVYNGNNTIVNSEVHPDSIYIPVVAVLKAFGVPAANAVWDGSRLTIYLSPTEPVYLTPGSVVDTSENGSTGDLQNPLLVIDGVPMLSNGTMQGFMFGFDKAPDHLLNGLQDSVGGADMYNGTVLIDYLPMPS